MPTLRAFCLLAQYQKEKSTLVVSIDRLALFADFNARLSYLKTSLSYQRRLEMGQSWQLSVEEEFVAFQVGISDR